jgi:5'(3')-deoxyribonucleotidase
VELLVDLDNTVADFDRGVIERMKERHGVTPESRTHRYIKEAYPDHLHDEVEEIYYEEGFFESLSTIQGAPRALRALQRNGYNITLCSSYLTDHRTTVHEKHEWIEDNIGEQCAKGAVFTRRKDKVRGDYLIDDKPNPRGENQAAWQHILFDQPYNRESTKPRVSRWRPGSIETLIGYLTHKQVSETPLETTRHA